MNIFERAGVVRPRKFADLYHVRQERIKSDGSEFFTWTPGVIAAGARVSIEVVRQFPRAKKYAPLDWVQVANSETVNGLTLTLNASERLPVLPGTIVTVSDKWLHEISITNNGAAATGANSITVTLQRQPVTIDSWARGEA